MATREGLAGELYRGHEVFASEFDRVFSRSWYCIGRRDPVDSPGSYMTAGVVDQPILVLRDHEGTLRAFHNVCRHRGSLLCGPGEGTLRRAIKCPYHAWSYSLDGRLIGTPNVGRDEIDRASLGLLPVRVDEWQGCLFVNLSGDAPTLREWLDDQDDQPLAFGKWDLDNLRVGHTTTRVIRANWKILVENYEECLHCPTVHPELVDLVPTYRRGAVVDPDRPDWGVALKSGAAALTASGTTVLPLLPRLSAEEAASVYGAYVFPNATIGVSGQVATLSTIHPRSVDTCELVVQYLFAPDTIAADGFDPSDVVDFSELVSAQDAAVCERVQLGVASRAFTHGVYPAMDSGLHWFAERYRSFLGRGTAGARSGLRQDPAD